MVSRYLLADLRSSQAPYIVPHHLAQADPATPRSCASSAGRATTSSRASRSTRRRARSRPVRARCSDAARPCSASRRWPTSRTCGSSARARWCMAATSRPSRPRSAMPKAPRSARCCANAWAAACAICAPICLSAGNEKRGRPRAQSPCSAAISSISPRWNASKRSEGCCRPKKSVNGSCTSVRWPESSSTTARPQKGTQASA